MNRILKIIDSIWFARFMFAFSILSALYNTAAAVGADKKYYWLAVSFIVANLVFATIALRETILKSREDSKARDDEGSAADESV